MSDYNLPNYDVDSITLGQCIVYMDPYRAPTLSGVTPSTDVGAIDEATISISRELLDLKQGTPQLLVQQWAVGETGQLKLKGWEWNINNFYKVFAAGATSVSGHEESFLFGGDYTVQPVQVRLQHKTPNGATIFLDFWRCTGSGSLEFQFNPKDFNKFDYTFNLWRGLTNWTNEALAVGTRLFRYTRINPSGVLE
jgi:hypothetical protein